jgi:hypothetical protein
VQHYIFANVRLDPMHEDLPWDRHLEIKNRIIETQSARSQAKHVKEHLGALHERVEARDVAASAKAEAQSGNEAPTSGPALGNDPTIYNSLASHVDFWVYLSEQDPLDEDIRGEYESDKMFSKVIETPSDHPDFEVKNGMIWMKNRGGDMVVCVPSAPSKDSTLHGHIIDQAHSIVGHFGLAKTVEYIRRWYWWPRLQYEVDKFCESCEACIRSKGEYHSPSGKLHSLPIPLRPWESISMDFIGPFLESEGFDYLWVVICCLSSMVHLVPVNTTTTATKLSSLFIKEIVRLHGLPGSIVSEQRLQIHLQMVARDVLSARHQIADVHILPPSDRWSYRVHKSLDSADSTILRGL